MKHIALRIVSGLVLIAVIAGIALLAYNAGVTHGTSLNLQQSSGGNGSPIYPAPYWWPFPFFGFGFFGLLALFFLISLAFGAFRMMLFGPRFGWHRMHRWNGNWGDRNWSEGVPPMVAEMHRRMHEADEKASTDPANPKGM